MVKSLITRVFTGNYRNECAICCLISSLRLEKEDDGEDVVEEEEEQEGD